MGQRKTLGGDRIGSGSNMKVDTKTFNRSTHDLGYIWRSTMSAGTLVPFMVEVGLPADSFDIKLGCEVLTLPTVGPLFGSMKVQLDIYTAPVRLYNALLHNNKLGIGLNMANVILPYMEWAVPYRNGAALEELVLTGDVDNSQINPSSILSYLGIRGFGIPLTNDAPAKLRRFNAVPLLAYWDIYKNYYANKQEEGGFVIHSTPVIVAQNVTDMTVGGTLLPQYPLQQVIIMNPGTEIIKDATTDVDPRAILLEIGGTPTQWISLDQLGTLIGSAPPLYTYEYNGSVGPSIPVRSWKYADGDTLGTEINLQPFALADIDVMRDAILQHPGGTGFDIFADSGNIAPYSIMTAVSGTMRSIMASQEGLGVKTYQSDLFNNWLNTEYIDGVNGIAAVTAVSTVGDSFTIDELILHKKVYDMLNDIMVSGGTYDDWQEVVYDHKSITRAETPIYWGSLIKELQFQEVVSNSEASSADGSQPLGTLAGRGRLGSKHKGGNINIRVDEISFLMGIVSITPRIDYSQGNEWHTSLETMDDFHVPYLDEIGFQELITEQMAWWDTTISATGQVITKSAGKQPAWINYMTNTNKIKGNFAVPNNSMFMVLARRYSAEFDGNDRYEIEDLTTYIDPTKFNHIFAQTSLDAQNYWVQIAVDMNVRRKLSARIMPNL